MLIKVKVHLLSTRQRLFQCSSFTFTDADWKGGKSFGNATAPYSSGGVQIELDIDPEDKVSREIFWLDSSVDLLFSTDHSDQGEG